MRSDVQQINARLNQLERSLTEVKNHQLRKKVNINININVLNYTNKTSMIKSKIMELKYPKWWPFTEISPTWFVFMLLSPILVQRLMNRIQQKKWLNVANSNEQMTCHYHYYCRRSTVTGHSTSGASWHLRECMDKDLGILEATTRRCCCYIDDNNDSNFNCKPYLFNIL